MYLRTEPLSEKKLIGHSLVMSMEADKTPQLWQHFMPQRKLIQHTIGSELYEVLLYDAAVSFSSFTGSTKFEKWAAVEVSNFKEIPKDMKSFTLASGLYAVFLHKGLASDFPATMNYIFGQWLPSSNYQLDRRPHFQVLGEKYKNNDPSSEEEVWIPIEAKH